MQRSEVRDTLHLLDHLVIDEDALIDRLTTMYETCLLYTSDRLNEGNDSLALLLAELAKLLNRLSRIAVLSTVPHDRLDHGTRTAVV